MLFLQNLLVIWFMLHVEHVSFALCSLTLVECWYVSHDLEWGLSMKIISVKCGWQAYTTSTICGILPFSFRSLDRPSCCFTRSDNINGWQATHDSYWSKQENFDLQTFAPTNTFFKDLPFLHESTVGSLQISLSRGWFSIKYHLLIRMFLRLDTDGPYAVTNGKILYKN